MLFLDGEDHNQGVRLSGLWGAALALLFVEKKNEKD